MTIGVDLFGNVTDQVNIAYPRRDMPDRLPEQSQLQIAYTHTDYINKDADVSFFYSALRSQIRHYEVSGVDCECG